MNIIRFMCPDIGQAAFQMRDFTTLPQRKPDFNGVKDFDLSDKLTLKSILNLIVADSLLINSVVGMLHLYLEIFLFNKEDSFLFEVASPASLLQEAIPQINSANRRIRRWAEQLMNSPAINTVKALDLDEKLTFKYVVDVIISNTYVIEVIARTVENYLQALADGQVKW